LNIAQDFIDVIEAATTTADGRIYPLSGEQDGTAPYVVYDISNSEPEEGSADAGETENTVITVACHGPTVDAARELAGEVRAAVLAGLDAAVIEDTQDERDRDTRRPAVVQTYRIWHERAY
jgi:hypothetical protein